MDIERIKKISEAKIHAGNVVNKVRKTLKEYKHGTQDIQEELSEVYKPIIKSQEVSNKRLMRNRIKCLSSYRKTKKH